MIFILLLNCTNPHCAHPRLNFSVSKSLMMYGSDGAGGLASSTNQLEDIEHFGDVVSLDDKMDSFLSHDGEEGRDLYGTLKPGLTEHKTESSKGFSFGEVGCIRTRNKVTCCHFSSDGKLLASAGHDKKVKYIHQKINIIPEDYSCQAGHNGSL
ncbi:transcriptional corepressor LEUNIG_HOMOLOG-like [Camellia sinensis]|uniref:transcriptional corepressor LEUNIG_HOMOLOG-like n=1 Tax=Camellia sinensis TaxID=4442 RepID=UPI0010359D80|nr:transcriptional corepressor LEUNIG_HOMOLOG-like [Camellia sinensis]